ncbi:MAG: immunoglobulin domain-containing protein, partial [Verrucomicrobiota bacterium]
MKRIIALCSAALAAAWLPAGAATLGEALNATNLTWSTGGGGTPAWVAQSVVTHDGSWAARSGTISHGRQTYLDTMVTGPGVLVFWWKVSSEQFDRLEFFKNGVSAASISGEVDWNQEIQILGTGANVLQWEYHKDFTISAGQDRGWVDEVSFFPGDPALMTQPASENREPGQSVTLSVTAGGTAPLRYQWWKEGVPLVDGGNIAGATTAVLVLTNLTGGDAGGYSVVVSNGLGSVTSAVARLTVMDPVITVQPVSQYREPGQSITFSVTAVGTPPVGYQWWKEGAALAGSTGVSLTLTNLHAGDAGNYRVAVTNQYGSATSTVAMLTVNLITVDSSFNPEASGGVYSLAVQPDGKILVGGSFTMLSGQPRNYIGRLNADGTLDSGFNPGANGGVSSLAVQADGKILVGGGFTTLGSQTHTNIGRLNVDGSVDSGFNPGAGGGSNPWVGSMAVQADGKILVGGNFTMLAGQTRNRIARLNADGTLDSGFNPGANDQVYALALQADGKILVGGSFTYQSDIVRLNAEGIRDSEFHPRVEGDRFSSVDSLAVQADGKILVGGYFWDLCGQYRRCIGRLNADGTLDSEFNPGGAYLNFPDYNPTVASLAVQADGKILVGGWFTALGGQTRIGIARLNADGSLDSEFNPGVNYYGGGLVSSLAVQADGKILVAGPFTTLGGQARNYIGRLN